MGMRLADTVLHMCSSLVFYERVLCSLVLSCVISSVLHVPFFFYCPSCPIFKNLYIGYFFTCDNSGYAFHRSLSLPFPLASVLQLEHLCMLTWVTLELL